MLEKGILYDDARREFEKMFIARALQRWGSAHPQNWNVAFCDGSVQSMSFDIDLETHRRLANRADSFPTEDNQ